MEDVRTVSLNAVLYGLHDPLADHWVSNTKDASSVPAVIRHICFMFSLPGVDIRGSLHESGLSYNPDRSYSVFVVTT